MFSQEWPPPCHPSTGPMDRQVQPKPHHRKGHIAQPVKQVIFLLPPTRGEPLKKTQFKEILNGSSLLCVAWLRNNAKRKTRKLRVLCSMFSVRRVHSVQQAHHPNTDIGLHDANAAKTKVVISLAKGTTGQSSCVQHSAQMSIQRWFANSSTEKPPHQGHLSALHQINENAQCFFAQHLHKMHGVIALSLLVL